MPRFRYYIASLFVVLSVMVAVGQRPVHVKWTTNVELTGKTTGMVRWTADIEAAWHIYGMQLPALADTPMPEATSFDIDEVDGIDWTGAVEASVPADTHFDEALKLMLPWWEGIVTFSRSFTITSKSNVITVTGMINYMVCSAKSCTPPTHERFEIAFDNPMAQVVPTQVEEPVKHPEIAPVMIDSLQNTENTHRTISDELDYGDPKLWLMFGIGILVGIAFIFITRLFRRNKDK